MNTRHLHSVFYIISSHSSIGKVLLILALFLLQLQSTATISIKYIGNNCESIYCHCFVYFFLFFSTVTLSQCSPLTFSHFSLQSVLDS